MDVFEGRPVNPEGRLEKEVEAYDLVDKLGIAYQRADHEPAATMKVCKEIDAVLGLMICKNLFLCNRQKTKFYLLLMPADKPSVSILGLMYDREHQVELLIDSDVLKERYFGCHPCINTSSVKMSTSDFTRRLLPALHHESMIVHL